MTGDVGLLEKRAQSRLWKKERERDGNEMEEAVLQHEWAEELWFGNVTLSLSSLLPACDGHGSVGSSTL